MSIRATLACDGEFPAGVRCRQATPVGEVANAAEARRVARTAHGWRHFILGDRVVDMCGGCAKRHEESLVPRPRRSAAEQQLAKLVAASRGSR